MLGNFSYSNPTKLYFGKDSLEFLNDELKNYGKNVLFIYGGGSIKKTGLYDQVITILEANGKDVYEDPGVMPNPTVEKLYEGMERAKKHETDLILAVGGGSVIDYAKAVSISTYCEEDPWEKYFIKMEDVDRETHIIPVGSVLTMVGTGSEMNGGMVISNHETEEKIGHGFGDHVFPKFSILNPLLTYTVPQYQMVAGFFDIMSHILEQYLSNEDDNTSDYLMEGLLKSLIHSSRIAVKNPEDYEARSNIMWTATWALNTTVGKGKDMDWMVHMLGQAIGAYTDATHGMTLSAVSLPYYKLILPYSLQKFKRYAINIWNVIPEGKSDEEIALEGLERMKEYMKEIGVVLNSKELGVTDDIVDGIVEKTFILNNGYKKLTVDEVKQVIFDSMKG